MTKSNRLKNLSLITQATAEKALLPVKRAKSVVEQLEQRTRDIADYRMKLISEANDPNVAGALLSQANRLLKVQTEVQRDLLTARIELEKARRKAAHHVGRNHAIEAIAQKISNQASIEKTRRRMRGA